MANAVYPRYKQTILTATGSPVPNTSLNVNTVQDGPYCSLVDTGVYTYNSGHQMYSQLSGVVGADQRLVNPVVDNAAVFDADDLTYTAVSGASIEALVVYRRNAGSNINWRLVFFEDTGVTGLPVTPNGGNITVTWNVAGILLISDRRLKENIREIDHLLGVFPVYAYNYVGETKRCVGLMAQDVAKVVPSAVVPFGRERKHVAVNYSQAIEAAFRIAA